MKSKNIEEKQIFIKGIGLKIEIRDIFQKKAEKKEWFQQLHKLHNESNWEEFGSVSKRLSKKLGFKQNVLAQRLGCSRKLINEIMNPKGKKISTKYKLEIIKELITFFEKSI